MGRRSRIDRRKSRRSFSRGAVRVNRRNLNTSPMRGGIRM